MFLSVPLANTYGVSNTLDESTSIFALAQKNRC